jgi:hypothetical protein
VVLGRFPAGEVHALKGSGLLPNPARERGGRAGRPGLPGEGAPLDNRQRLARLGCVGFGGPPTHIALRGGCRVEPLVLCARHGWAMGDKLAYGNPVWGRTDRCFCRRYDRRRRPASARNASPKMNDALHRALPSSLRGREVTAARRARTRPRRPGTRFRRQAAQVQIRTASDDVGVLDRASWMRVVAVVDEEHPTRRRKAGPHQGPEGRKS